MARRIADNSRDFHANAFVQCAHEGCEHASMIKLHTATGWANLCMPHYEDHFRRQALANLPKWGMARTAGESQSDHVARMRQFVKGGFKRFAANAGKR